MKNKTFVWEDDFCPESYCLVLSKYGLQLLKAKAVKGKPNKVKITVSGPTAALDTFIEDCLEDSFSCLDQLSEQCEDDEQYAVALKFASEVVRAKNNWPKI